MQHPSSVNEFWLPKNQILVASDHNFSNINLTSTVVLLFKFPQRFDGYSYRETQFLCLKFHVIELPSAAKNAKEFAEVMLDNYRSQKRFHNLLAFIPKHSPNFSRIKTAISWLFRYF